MPGMMTTVLNLGMNDDVVAGLAASVGPQFAWDCYHRFLGLFGQAVLGIDAALFAQALRDVQVRPHSTMVAPIAHLRSRSLACCAQRADGAPGELTVEQLQLASERYKAVYVAAGHVFPEAPETQLQMAVAAGFWSWESERTRLYRQVQGITDMPGAAVTVQVCTPPPHASCCPCGGCSGPV